MQIGVVRQGGGQSIEDGRAPRQVRVSLHPAATHQFSTGGSRADSPLRQGNLVSVDRVERLGQLALSGGQVSLGERSLGEPLAAERQVRPLAGRRREPTQLLHLFACAAELLAPEPVLAEPQPQRHLKNRAHQRGLRGDLLERAQRGGVSLQTQVCETSLKKRYVWLSRKN